jgi:heme-degrading monooxygenase HmoA
MAFIRTTTFAMTREDAEELRPGKLVYSAIVGGRKFICQTLNGLIATGVWRSVNPSGKVVFTIFTEWSTMDDLQAYARQPTIRELEEQLATETEPLTVMVYENIG